MSLRKKPKFLCFEPTHQTKSKKKQKSRIKNQNKPRQKQLKVSEVCCPLAHESIYFYNMYIIESKEQNFRLQNFFNPIVASNRCSLSLAGNFCLPQMKNNETRSKQGPLITDGRDCNEILILRTGLL